MIELNQNTQITKPETEQVEQEKQEYKLIDRIVRTPGLKLYAYSNGIIKEVEIKPVDTLELDEGLNPKSINIGDCVVNANAIYFEALNRKTALKRG